MAILYYCRRKAIIGWATRVLLNDTRLLHNVCIISKDLNFDANIPCEQTQ